MLFGNLCQHLVDLRSNSSCASVSSDGDCYSETSEAVSAASSDKDNDPDMEPYDRSGSLMALEGLDDEDGEEDMREGSAVIDKVEEPELAKAQPEGSSGEAVCQ